MFDKYRSLSIALVLISFFVYIGYRNEQNVSRVVHEQIEEEKKRFEEKINIQQETSFSEEQIKSIVKDYILNNPSIITEALDKLQQARMDEMKKQVKEQISLKKDKLENPESPYIGNIVGKSVIVMFYDLRCNFCKQAFDVINSFAKDNKDVKVILRPYPILGAEAESLARIVLAVYINEPSKFKIIHEELLSDKTYNKEELVELFKENGLSYNKMETLGSSEQVSKIISENKSLAKDLKINGVPSFIINGNFYHGFLSTEQLKEAVKFRDEVQAKEDKKTSDKKEPVVKSDESKAEKQKTEEKKPTIKDHEEGEDKSHETKEEVKAVNKSDHVVDSIVNHEPKPNADKDKAVISADHENIKSDHKDEATNEKANDKNDKAAEHLSESLSPKDNDRLHSSKEKTVDSHHESDHKDLSNENKDSSEDHKSKVKEEDKDFILPDDLED
jgi:protein-disulfide isomerase